MITPFEQNLSELKDSEIESKVQELTKKYFMAQRLGKHNLLTQLSTFITIYKDELSRRMRERTKQEFDGDLDQLINVD
jgi:hypothetical protein